MSFPVLNFVPFLLILGGRGWEDRGYKKTVLWLGKMGNYPELMSQRT